MAKIDDYLGKQNSDDFLVQPLANSAYALSMMEGAMKDTSRRMQEAEKIKIQQQNAPLVKELKSIIGVTQHQNKILLEQNRLLLEERDRQMTEITHAMEKEKVALQEAKRANKRFWISTGIAIASLLAAIASVVISII